MKRYLWHARACSAQAFDGGVLYISSGYVLRLCRLIILTMIWRQILSGQGGDLSAAQALGYTFWSSVLSEQLDVRTPASEDFWMGTFGMRYLRPLPVLAQVAAETAGRWVPGLLFFSAPMLLIAPLLGIDIAPVSAARGLAAVLSLALAISLGFALDFLFTAFAVRLKNNSYQAKLLRGALMLVCSGAVIPFAAMPWGLGDLLALSPLGSLAGAPLSIYTGLSDAAKTLLIQLVWNALLWPLALYCFHKSEEGVVSYGG